MLRLIILYMTFRTTCFDLDTSIDRTEFWLLLLDVHLDSVMGVSHVDTTKIPLRFLTLMYFSQFCIFTLFSR
jgi:hypothetical protein